MSRLAVYNAKLGRAKEAELRIAAAKRLRPDDSSVLFREAVVFSLGKQPKRAMQAVREAVAKGYSTTLIRDEDDLTALRALPEFKGLVNRQ